MDSARTLANELHSTYSDKLEDIPPEADFIIVAVDDTHLEKVLRAIKTDRAIIMHTSGSIGIEIFNGLFTQFGVLYPFQTFTQGIPLEMIDVPFCVEGSDIGTLNIICELAGAISNNVRKLNSEQRCLLHLCGALTNNFTNHLVSLATDLMIKHNLEKELLIPLLRETVHKLEKISARNAQTGPARRKNFNIIERHLEMLNDEPGLKKLYSSLTDSIIAYYSK